MWFYTPAPIFTESEIRALENQATNPAELFIIRRFLENHARRSLKETREGICQSGDTEFLESNVTRICSGLMKHSNLPGDSPDVERIVNRLSDFILAKARQSMKFNPGQHEFHSDHVHSRTFPGSHSDSRDF